jgi:transposase
MIAIGPQTKILVAIEHVDFRKGIDGLAAHCKQQLSEDPFSGVVFVFRNRKSSALKILYYDGNGFWLCQKRLSEGRFGYWPRCTQQISELVLHELQVLVAGGNPTATKGAPIWRSIKK